MTGQARPDPARRPLPDGPGFALPRSALFWFITLVIVLDFARLHVVLNGQNPVATLDQLIDRTATPPSLYRILIPELIGAAETILRLLGLDLNRLEVAAMVEAGFLVGLVVVVYNLLNAYVADRRFTALATLGVFVPLFHTYYLRRYLNVYYPYDIPQVFFFALGAYLILQGRLRLFYPTFVLAVLTRETGAFLAVMLFALQVGRMPLRRLAGHVAALAALYLTLRAGLILSLGGYQTNFLPDTSATEGGKYFSRGGLFWFGLTYNATDLFRRPAHIVPVLGLYAYTFVPLLILCRRLPFASLKRFLWVMAPYLAAGLTFGIIVEFRVYGEMIPVMWVAVSVLAAQALGVGLRRLDPLDVRAAAQPSPSNGSMISEKPSTDRLPA